MSAKRKAEPGPLTAPPLAYVTHKPEMPAEGALGAAVPAEMPPLMVPPMVRLGEVFPFGAFVQRENGERIKPGDVLLTGERLSVSTPAASAPPMGFSIRIA